MGTRNDNIENIIWELFPKGQLPHFSTSPALHRVFGFNTSNSPGDLGSVLLPLHPDEDEGVHKRDWICVIAPSNLAFADEQPSRSNEHWSRFYISALYMLGIVPEETGIIWLYVHEQKMLDSLRAAGIPVLNENSSDPLAAYAPEYHLDDKHFPRIALGTTMPEPSKEQELANLASCYLAGRLTATIAQFSVLDVPDGIQEFISRHHDQRMKIPCWLEPSEISGKYHAARMFLDNAIREYDRSSAFLRKAACRLAWHDRKGKVTSLSQGEILNALGYGSFEYGSSEKASRSPVPVDPDAVSELRRWNGKVTGASFAHGEKHASAGFSYRWEDLLVAALSTRPASDMIFEFLPKGSPQATPHTVLLECYDNIPCHFLLVGNGGSSDARLRAWLEERGSRCVTQGELAESTALSFEGSDFSQRTICDNSEELSASGKLAVLMLLSYNMPYRCYERGFPLLVGDARDAFFHGADIPLIRSVAEGSRSISARVNCPDLMEDDELAEQLLLHLSIFTLWKESLASCGFAPIGITKRLGADADMIRKMGELSGAYSAIDALLAGIPLEDLLA